MYEKYLVPVMPYIFGQLHIFYLPEDIKLPFDVKGIKDRYIKTKIYLTKHYHDKKAQELIKELKERNCYYIVKGKLPVRRIMPYADIGYLSSENTDCLKFNSSFFSFDVIDADSPYDIYGTPIGLNVKDGKILNPPQFNREALLVYKNGEVKIKNISIRDIKINIEGRVYERGEIKYTPYSNNRELIVIKDEVVAIKNGGHNIIPSTGFIINTKNKDIKVGDKVIYSGLEDVVFSIQVGNSVIKDNIKTEEFTSSFYNVYSLKNKPFPPSMYPLNYKEDKAPRMVLGANQDNKPVVVFVEGANKLAYQKGIDSIGASLSQLADILQDLKIKNAINLDGGGSAQILINNKRKLKVSNRDSEGNEIERPVPIGLIYRQ